MDEFTPLDDSDIDKLVSEDDSQHSAQFADLLARQKKTIDNLLDAKISSDDNQDEVRIKARVFALNYLPEALKTIGELVTSGDKDSTRLAAARTIWAIASTTSAKDDSDPLERMFKQLEKKSSESE